MDSFQPSRGRTLFELLCALALAGSLAGAWMQTGASALLGAAAAATLFGLSHALGMKRRTAATAAEPQRIDFAAVGSSELSARLDGEDVPAAEPQLVEIMGISEPTEAPLPSTKGRRAKAPRKAAARRSKAADEVKTAVAAADEADEGAAVPLEAEFAMSDPTAEPDHPRIEPLFEPEPYFRQRRAAFGRRGRI